MDQKKNQFQRQDKWLLGVCVVVAIVMGISFLRKFL
jgi:hypothetical protein